MRFGLFIVFFLSLFAAATTCSAENLINKFSETGLAGWTHKKFKGETEYTIVDSGEQKVLQAKSQAAASGLIFATDYDPRTYPTLTWRWKISDTIASGDSRHKDTDDYAARIYVVFPHWFFPLSKTINYIWSNRLPKGSSQLNVYTSNAMMIAVASGPVKAGEWVTVKRDIAEDYRKAFGEEPPNVGAIAVMTDTDNTGSSAIAWYGDITASR